MPKSFLVKKSPPKEMVPEVEKSEGGGKEMQEKDQGTVFEFYT